ncbi:hypothetical protein [Corallococcus aberystwythensis]|uniref:Lipoprotein n=1 Tax=Corallococcus aberystwythensis TaxID=2316722 RepID=A0A3A8R103_9BACT|nr:hypothetical protein [Corallococcus aberystwythensis]RKH73678.1 hypothetical protein D7W81_03220 [Corallococcus aberystwythensis]
MFRPLALMSAAALGFLCTACGAEEEPIHPGETQDTRYGVAGSYPVTMTMSGAQPADEALLPGQASVVLAVDTGSRDKLRVSIKPLECDLTATMTGSSTFDLNPGSCRLVVPPHDEQQSSCTIVLAINEGSGGRDPVAGRVGLTFNASYTRRCADSSEPYFTGVLIKLEGT